MSITYNEPGVTYNDPLYTYDGGAPQPLSLHVEFAPGVASSAVPTEAQWVDLTNDVLRLSSATGRTDELASSKAGELNLLLDNASGKYDPDNTAGPYAGQLLPLVWFRAYSREDTGVFSGQVSIEGWRLRASQFLGQMVVELTVLDMFEQMANTNLPSSVYELEVKVDNPRAWYRLGESSGTVVTDSSGNGRHGTYEGGATFNSRAGLIVEDANNAIEFDGVDDRAAFPGITSDAIEFWIKTPAQVSTAATQILVTSAAPSDYAVAVGLLGTSAGADVGKIVVGPTSGQAISTVRVDDGRTHHVVVIYSPTPRWSVYVDSVDRTLSPYTGTFEPAAVGSSGFGSIGGPVGAPAAGYTFFAGTLDEVAIYYPSIPSVARFAAHHTAGTKPWEGDRTDQRITKLLDAAGFPAALRTIEVGASSLRRAALDTDLLSALRDVATAERGELYVDHADAGKVRFRGRHARWTATASTTSQATFGDGGGTEVEPESIIIQDARIINRATAQRRNGSSITVSDAASETQYQRRSYSALGLLVDDDDEVRGRAELLVAENKDRHRQVQSVTLVPTDSADPAWIHVFGRRIGDRVTVRWRPPYGGTYTFASYIEGVHHDYDASHRALRTTFVLSSVPYGGVAGETTYFVWDSSKWDTDARWGY